MVFIVSLFIGVASSSYELGNLDLMCLKLQSHSLFCRRPDRLKKKSEGQADRPWESLHPMKLAVAWRSLSDPSGVN